MIPSQFFALDGAEHVSAVLFSNSGTIAKFSPMGYQAGLDPAGLRIRRRGFRHDLDPNADTPLEFDYWVGERDELWGEGISLIHNPRAVVPLDDGAFPQVSNYRLEGGVITSTGPAFHPFISRTEIYVIRDS